MAESLEESDERIVGGAKLGLLRARLVMWVGSFSSASCVVAAGVFVLKPRNLGEARHLATSRNG